MIFSKTQKVKAIKMIREDFVYVRVISGDNIDNIDLDYSDYESLDELRAVIECIYHYLGFEAHSTFGDNHFVIYIDNKEILKVADILLPYGE